MSKTSGELQQELQEAQQELQREKDSATEQIGELAYKLEKAQRSMEIERGMAAEETGRLMTELQEMQIELGTAHAEMAQQLEREEHDHLVHVSEKPKARGSKIFPTPVARS